MTWTEERIDLLTALWGEGLSASRCAKLLGNITRNSVIGKIHRLGLSRPKPKYRVNQRKKGPKRSRRAIATKKQLVVAEETYKEAYTTKADDLLIPLEQRKTFEQLRPAMCKFPVGHVHEPDFFFCGAQCDRTVPYCDEHARRCSVPVRRLNTK